MRVIIKQFATDVKDGAKVAQSDGFNKGEALKGVTPTNGNYARADNNQVKSVLNTVYTWAGIICVAIVIVSGIYYVISTGDAGKIKRAKDALMYAIVGLVIVILAFAITNFVIGAV